MIFPMNGRMNAATATWCSDGAALVRLLRDNFGQDNVAVRSPHHIQVRLLPAIHNLWIDSHNVVKYKLAGQAGHAEISRSGKQLLQAISGHNHDATDLADMRKALELSELIKSAKKALPLAGVSRAVFVDAGLNERQAQIAVVEVSIESDGEHVRAESRPVVASDPNTAEKAAIDYAVTWSAPGVFIFCDNQSVVDRARDQYGDRIRWLPRERNKIADGVANLRGKKKKRRKPRSGKAKPR